MNLIKRILDAVNEGVIVAGNHKRSEGQKLIEQIQSVFQRDPWNVAQRIEAMRRDWDRQDSEYMSAISSLPASERYSATEKRTLNKIHIRRTAQLMEAIYGEVT